MLSLPPTYLDKFLIPFIALIPGKYRYKSPGEKLHKIAKILKSDSIEETYLKLISHWENSKNLLNIDEPKTILNNEIKLDKEFSIQEKMMYLDTLTYLPDDILVKVDRAQCFLH